MARFYATVKGSRGEASRLGTAASGISGHVRGWNVGGSVTAIARDAGEHDTVVLWLTGGSNGWSNLGIEVAAYEGMTTGTEYIVRLPGDIEIRGRVGDAMSQAYDVSAGYDAPSEPYGRLLYTFNKEKGGVR